MATSQDEESLESLLNKATDPANQEDRWDFIQGFYELVKERADGLQVATRLLAHKIQSPQEREALQALTVLEACMNNCGKTFHSEVAKFRFLNELIKVLTPKYLGQWSPQKVKDRVTEVLYSWTLWLKDENKIQEAYHMLKKQGLVKEDPKLTGMIVMPPLPQRTTDSVFEQEEKAKLLARLLKSARPEDLQTANKLIKNTIKEEQEKAERVAKRVSILEEVATSTRKLKEQLDIYSRSGNSVQGIDNLKAQYERCDKLRPSLFRLASDTIDDDSALAQILAANDELTLVVTAYKDTLARRQNNRGGKEGSRTEKVEGCKNDAPTSSREIKTYHLIDLSAVDSPPTRRQAKSPAPIVPCDSSSLEGSFHSVVDPELMGTGLNGLVSNPSQPPSTKTYYEELMQLSGDFSITDTGLGGEAVCLLKARGCGGISTSSHGPNTWSFPQKPFAESGSLSMALEKSPQSSLFPVKLEETPNPPQSLAHIHVPVETIKPSWLEPITVYNQDGIHVSLHFAKDTPPGHPSIAVVVLSMVNTSALLVKDFLFKAAVPKTMSVKLQASSGTHLPPYNPLLPPAAISQVLLLANPQKCKVRLRYNLTLIHGDQQLNETGEIDNFPDWDSLVGFQELH
ncbi:ADP-ribosylation factor-binding protein GGA3-like [Lampris incognitus]|uniref:ADP-ribosylation factor-binding protein GGA3-like n=1 Tax=Lampris incognitus TaxID=2546036 RepID=UPI0024B5CE30|nr:ADP-ribosylation factor-binding protein GGA3-like [Lampris incognitus]